MRKLLAFAILLHAVLAFSGSGSNDHKSDQLTRTASINTVPYKPSGSDRADFVRSMRTNSAHTDMFGTTHTRYGQTYRGLTVIGAEIVEHSRDGKRYTTGRMAEIGNLSTRPSIGQDAAQAIASAYGSKFDASLAVLPLKDGAHLVWHFVEQSADSRWVVFVDAKTGDVLNAYNNIHSGTGTGVLGDSKSIDSTFNGSTYELVASDNSRATYDAKTRKRTPGDLMTDSDDVWTDGAAVDAHHYAGLVLEYYMEQFGRNSYDDQGAQIISSVHYDRNLVNAYWNGTQMLYGDGDGVNSLALSGGFDVVAHEITHAVTENTSNLIYQNESGALNEAFSDIMGATAEYFKQPGMFDWKLGEDIWTPGIAGDALRYMDDPTADGSSSDHYDDRYTGTADNGGVHWNSGIANLAFYLASEGGPHPTYGGNTTGVGIDTASQVFYIGFTGLSSSATFSDARAACTQAALDNYGQATADLIDAAWVAVGVPSGGSTGPTEIIVAPGVTFQSDHPYASNENLTWSITNPGASSITVNFSQLDMERNYDYIYVKDANDNVIATYTGKSAQGATVVVNGETAKVNMVTDQSVNKQGFTAVAN